MRPNATGAGWRGTPLLPLLSPLLLAVLTGAAAGGTIRAQGASAQEVDEAAAEEYVREIMDPTVWTLEPESSPALPTGRIAVAEGAAGSAGVQFKVGDLDIMQPVQVTLLTPESGAPLRLELRKYHWSTEPDRSSDTGAAGIAIEPLRTQGDLYVRVVSPAGTRPYRLGVWVGDAVEPERKPAVVAYGAVVGSEGNADASAGSAGGASADAGRDSAGGGGGLVLYVIAGLLAAVVVLLGVLVLRRPARSGKGGAA
ncbi:MAG TPA: hypothetical protein VK837_14435 [Longimicrobiales bacterium]|nr:hypothetical protein [Longimicrobiales bacterium]